MSNNAEEDPADQVVEQQIRFIIYHPTTMPIAMNAFAPDISRVPAPLVVGVTGHRDLRPEDLDKLSQEVRKILLQLRGKYPSTPLILLSSLAEGADRLVARVALQADIGARLVAPLPMQKQLYEQDFCSPGSLSEFRELLARADYSIEMPLLAANDEVASPGGARDRQYEEAGKYIAGESQILIALWDGVHPGKIGGTGEVVRFQLEGTLKADFSLQPPEAFPVYHILTPRQSDPCPAGELFQTIALYPEGFSENAKAQLYYETLFHNLDDFNQCILQSGDWLIAAAMKSKSDLLGDFDTANLSLAEIQEVERYSVADALAGKFQGRLMWMHRALHWMVFIAFLCLVLFAHLPEHPATALAASLIVLGGAYLWHRWGGGKKLDKRSQDYRAIAEGSRVRLFWRLADVHESVAEYYLGKQRTELDWIRNGLRGWEMGPSDLQHPGTMTPQDRLQWVSKLWIDDQIDYFHRRTGANTEKLERTEMLVQTCIWLVLGIGIAMLGAAVLIEFDRWNPHNDEWLAAPVIALDFFLGAAALLHHAAQQRAYAEHIKQFSRMETIFKRARSILQQELQTGNLAAARQTLSNLGREALLENGDWVLLHRERPLELPHP